MGATDQANDIETQPLVQTKPKHFLSLGASQRENVLWLLAWMVLSCCIILSNKRIFVTGGFPYPLTLTFMHMTSCFLVFGAIRHFAPQHVKLAIMPDIGVPTQASWATYLKSFGVISIFYAGTLGTGQMAYMFSSVAFVQMMKPMNCICASIAAFAVGMEIPTSSHLIIVCIIAFGVCYATHGAGTAFVLAGCLLQVASSITEGFRLAMMQLVQTSGMKVDPVTTVYHFSFPSAIFLALAAAKYEWPLDMSKFNQPGLLAANCMMAVALNVIVATVIKKTSAVVFTLSGVIKDMALIAASAFMFATPITTSMWLGYSMSIFGLCMYKVYKDHLSIFTEHGFFRGVRETYKSFRAA
jgi:hypothetical protein